MLVMRSMSSWLIGTIVAAPEPIGPKFGPGASVLDSS
jgi:hypothetical protein